MTWISVQLYTIITLIDILSYYQKYICKKRMLQKKHLLQVRAIVVYCIGSMRMKCYLIITIAGYIFLRGYENTSLHLAANESKGCKLIIFHFPSSCNFIQQFVVERFSHFQPSMKLVPSMQELYVLLDQSHVAGGKSSSYYARFSLAVLYYVSIVIFKINGMYGAST